MLQSLLDHVGDSLLYFVPLRSSNSQPLHSISSTLQGALSILPYGRILPFIGDDKMISQDLLEILRCPACVREKEGLLKLVKNTWLVCQEPDCGRKYPIREDIPVMLIDEGDKWTSVAEKDLPIPPPND